MKGDNRLGNIFYATATYANQQLVLDGEENSTLTVANINKTSNANHFNSAIGGSDSSEGMIFNSGIIWAGTTYINNCTAIGGGGNEKGGVFSIWGGTLGIGILVTEMSVFNDYRQGTYQVLADSDESLTYELIDEEKEEIIEVDDCIVTFSNENLDEKNMVISIK